MRNSQVHILIATIFCLAIFTPKCFSQAIKENVNFYNYTIENGLPSAETYDILQDSKGFIWIGTDNGVVKFDGARFKTYTTRDGLTDNTVFKIYEDYQSRIWFLTYNRKLCLLVNDKVVPYVYNDVITEELKHVPYSNTITEFSVDSNNQIFINLTHRITKRNPSLTIDRNGKATQSPLDENPNPFKTIQLQKSLESVVLESIRYVNENPSFTNHIIHTKNFVAIRIHRVDSLLFVGTQNGLFICSLTEKRILQHVLPSYYITSVSHDFEGGLWCTSLNNGVFYIPNPNVHSFSPATNTRSQINAILPYDSSLLFYFNNDLGNYEYDSENNLLEPTNETVKITKIDTHEITQGIKMVNTIYLEEIYADINSLLYINTNKYIIASSTFGIRDVTIETDRDFSIPKDFLSNIGALNNQFYAKDNLCFYRGKNSDLFLSKTISDTIPRVLKILKTDNQTALLGTLSGLYSMNLSNNKINKSDLLGLNDLTRIQDIIKLESGELLFATKGKGIISHNNGQVTTVNIRYKGKTNSINQLLQAATPNSFYAATNYGIYQLKKEKSDWKYHLILTQLDGPKLSDIRQIATSNNRLFFANNNGMGYIPVSKLEQNTPPPKLYINHLQLEKEKIKSGNKITLPYDSNFFDISYQAISYKSQNNFTYYYRLNDQTQWRTTTNSLLTFNSLDPGVYQFEIKAANAYGVESDIQKLNFEILTPYWLTWWFIALAVLVVIALFGLIIYRIITFYKNQTAIQRKLNELQVLSLQSKMSPHFIFNSLNSIQNYILTNNKMAANEYLIEFSRLIRTILKNSEKSTILLSKELEILNLYVELEKKRLRKPFSYKIDFKGNIDLTSCVIPSLLIQPYVENSIWHGQVYNNPEGEIRIIIEQKMKSLFITISDNGIGMKKAAELKKMNNPEHISIGTKTTKNRIELISGLNAQLSEVIISETHSNSPNREFVGTTIKFSIPYILNSPDL